MSKSDPSETLAVVGDVHGHLQLALCLLARWQRCSRRPFSAVLLCGDVGTFTCDSQPDSATVRHARDNPCELEFLRQWSAEPPAPWLEPIFLPEGEGLGLTCPVVMVHGNHEGFEDRERLAHGPAPVEPVAADELPAPDAGGRVLYLPSGWRLRTSGGHVVAGIGGIERGQCRADYHSMAYLDQRAVTALSSGPPADLLVSHQGPAWLHGEHGSESLDRLLSPPAARASGATGTAGRPPRPRPPDPTAGASSCRSATWRSPGAGGTRTRGSKAGVCSPCRHPR